MLIDNSLTISYIDWQKVEKMIEEAESEEAKRILHSRACTLYHIEEYYAGLL